MKRAWKWLWTAALFVVLALTLLWFQGLLGGHPEAGPPTSIWRPLASSERKARVVGREVADARVHPATVEAVDPAEVQSRTTGQVLSVAVEVGDAVQAGALLAQLDPSQADARLGQAEAALAGAEAQSLAAGLAFARAEKLLAAQAITTADWEAARAARDAASAAAERAGKSLAEARDARSWCEVRAPTAGTVSRRSVDPGDLALPGRALFELFLPGRLRLRAALPERLATGLARGDPVEVRFDAIEPFAATIEQVLPDADPATGTVIVRVSLGPVPGLRPGVDARIAVGQTRRTATFVPRAAVQRVGQIERALLVRDGLVLAVNVRTGKPVGDEVEVLAGLEPGDEVVLP